MRVLTTQHPEVLLLEPELHGDQRGFFLESWNERAFAELGLHARFVQDNHSKSAHGILRGLHYQTRQVQGKLVRVIAGEVFDVAVDMRRASPHYGRWSAAILSAANHRMLWIPPGFAHGFYVTGESAEFVYKCSDYYAPEHEVSMRWDDPDLAIEWPLLAGTQPLLSTKDANGVRFRDAPAL